MINLIPKPEKCVAENGKFFVFNAEKGVTFDKSFKTAAAEFEKICVKRLGFTPKKGSEITFGKVDGLDDEGYTLEVGADGVKVSASTDKGAFYAVQSLRIMGRFDAAESGEAQIPAAKIEDKPRFKWRGFMLDEARHFFGKDEVKRLLDIMAMFKLNVFHWHLTDDQGWRIDIKKYPLLKEIASKRKATHINGWQRSDVINEPYEGCYSQDDIKEIVAYAAALNIMVVPEIDMPAHFRAVFAAYPELACEVKKTEVPWYFGAPAGIEGARADGKRVACVGKEATFEFIFNVIDEISDLFPAPYFHIGGDEVPKELWKTCPDCQKTIKDNNLGDEEGLQAWFNNRIVEYIKGKGKRLIGWNEVLKNDSIDKSVIAQYWTLQNDSRAIKWANAGNNVILSKHQSFYFDMGYNLYPLKNTYNFEPQNLGIKKEAETSVLGVEGPLWTEWVDGREKIDVSIFPRMFALSEVAWTPSSGRNLACFLDRWHAIRPIMDKMEILYAEDAVCMPKNPIKRLYYIRLWYAKDQYIDVKRNRKFRAKRLREEAENAE